MYRERMFETWKEGLLHLAIVVVIPILPIIIYMITEPKWNGYLYVLVITVTVSLAYEFINFPDENCGKILKAENIVCCVNSMVMIIWALFLLLLTYTNKADVVEGATDANNAAGVESAITTNDIKVCAFILVFLFVIPVIITIIEIIRCIILDFNISKFQPSENNLVKGAREV